MTGVISRRPARTGGAAPLPLFAEPEAKQRPARPAFVRPSPGQLRDAQRAMLPSGLPAVHARFVHRGWDIAVFDSPYGADMLLVHAMRGSTWLSEEVADQDAARRWVGGLPP